jgi:hypothetical protein
LRQRSSRAYLTLIPKLIEVVALRHVVPRQMR